MVFYHWCKEDENRDVLFQSESFEQVSERTFMELVRACEQGGDYSRICRACREMLKEYRMNQVINLMTV